MAHARQLPVVPRDEVDLSEPLEWVRKPQLEYVSYHTPETFREKAIRKTTANPLVPIGILATTCALGYGLYAMRTGNIMLSQYMMRARVAAQGFTIIALVSGILYSGSRAK